MPRRTVSRLGAALRGLLSLAVLAALLLGVPVLLWRTGILPDQVPTWQDVTSVLTGPDSGSVFMGALTLLGWAGWLSFVGSTLVEIGALLRRRRAPRVRVFGATQRLAASLVAGVALLLPTSAAFAAAPAASASTISVPAAVAADSGVHHAAATKAAADAYTGPTHRVVDGDTLWDLAEHYLGSGSRWHSIADLNPQVNANGLLQSGEVLRLPADAAAAAAGNTGAGPAESKTAPPAAQHTVTVEEGDTLSRIAQEELGSADAYPQLLEASKDVVQPGGRVLTDPDRLYPGDVIVIPAPTVAQPAPAVSPAPAVPAPEAPTVPIPSPEAATPTPASPAPAPSPAAPSTAPAAPSQTAPAAEPSLPPAETIPTPAASAAPAETEHAGPATTAANTTASTAAPDSTAPITLQQGLGAMAALLGASSLATLALRRRAQQRERRPGEEIAVPEETSQTEMVLDRTSSPALVDLLDRSLRTLAHQHPQQLPEVIGARVQQDRVEILVEDADSEALSPFTDRPGGWWGVRGDRAVLLDAEQARSVPAPYPGLATIGTADDGTLLLANLPHTRVLLLEGNEQNVREVARGIAMEAGTAVWADHTEIMTVAFGLELQQLLPLCRTMYVPRLATATADLARVMIETHQAEHEGGEEPQPWMVVCPVTPDADELYEFADVLGKVPAWVRVSAVLPAAGGARELFTDAEILNADLVDELQMLESLDTEAVLQRVTDDVYRQLTAAMTTAVQPAVPAEGVWAEVPDPDRNVFGPSSLLPHKNGASSKGHLSLLATPAEMQDADASPEDPSEDEAANLPTVPSPASPVTAETDSAAKHEDAAQPQDLAPGSVPAATPVVKEQGAPLQVRPAKTKPRVSVLRDGDAPAPHEGSAPQVQVLGPLRITGVGDAPIPPTLVLLAALLIFKSDRDYGAIANYMDPVSPWTQSTMDTYMSRLRRRLGVDAGGEPYLRPKPKGVEQYALSEAVSCDYADFLHLAERGLPHGTAGVLDLEAALSLVRGRPFGGGGAHTWAAPLVQTMIGKIVDVAHTVATLRIQDEVLDIEAARHAVSVGLDVEPTAEVLYRDWMRIEHQAGNPAGVREVIAQVRQMTSDWGFDGMLQDETEQLVQRLTANRSAGARLR